MRAAPKRGARAETAKKKVMFKPCAGCPAPAKCKAMGKCMKKAMAKK